MKHKFEIEKPIKNDLSEIRNLFEISVREAYKQNNIDDNEDLENHITRQILQVEDFLLDNSDSYYLVAKESDQIIGIIAYGKPKDIHIKNLGGDSTIPLIRSVYVHTDFQGKGIGTKLFKEIVKYIKKLEFSSFYIDAGYNISQKYWVNRLGKPDVELKNYYGNGDSLFLWKVEIENLQL